MSRDVFKAIADPTRREIIKLLAHSTLNLTAVTEQFEISQPAISRHIKVLQDCGLVEIEQRGRERFCRARPERLDEVVDWVKQFRTTWEDRLDSLEKLVQSAARQEIQLQASPAQQFAIVISRIFNVPAHRLWELWTDPGHLGQWWGISGRAARWENFDLRPGGEWQCRFTGEKGKDHQAKGRFLTVEPPSRLIMEGDLFLGPREQDQPAPGPVTVEFHPMEKRTRLQLSISHASEEDRRWHEAGGAVDHWNENFARLREYIHALNTRPNN